MALGVWLDVLKNCNKTNMEFDEILVKETPGLCRCCLSEGCYKDLSTEYTWMDEQEIYADMLLECFDISISQHMEGPNGPNRLICEVCITRLRDASNFKKQVLDSEKKFVDMVGRGEFKAKVVVAYEPVKAETSELQPVEEIEVEYLPLPNEVEYLHDDTDFDDGNQDDPEPSVSEDVTVTALPVKGKHGRPKKTVVKLEKKIPKTEEKPKTKIAKVDPVVLATNPGNEEHPTDSSDDWDILSFENNANVLEDPRKSQDTALIPKESLATIKPFACELCNYKCTANSSLVTHMRTHTGEKPFACELCKNKFSQKSNLVSHMRTHTGEKPFACELCNYKCTTRSDLVNHMRTHTGEKPFTCELCNYKCTTKSNLVNHMRTHTGEKPFACELCKSKYTRKSSLVTHMRTHTGEKPFACELCKHKCITKNDLVKHMRTHTGEKPFACRLCKYESTDNSNFVRHMRSHTGEKHFACKLCKYKCIEKGNLVRHMRTHTGEKPLAC